MAIALMTGDDRPQHGDDRPDRRARAPARRGRGRRARCSWGPSRRARRAGRPRSTAPTANGDRVQQRRRARAAACEDRLDQVGDRRLADGTEAQRADGDAELGAADHQRDVLHRPQRGAGDARARPRRAARSGCAGRETRANSAPTKNALPSEQHDGQQDAERSPLIVGLLARCRSSPSSSRRSSRSMRRPSIRSTVRVTSRSRGSSGSVRSGTGDLDAVAGARGSGRARAARGRRRCRSPRGRAARCR